ncbi:MAG: DNA alkylation repair protein [Candidatus Paceibacterota bacterium]|jgi:3-methyladenine DNA glycosylase AlkD|nr:DNA alkylation repair protein [Candidatus Paceibacterota bacterium]MDD4831105.1 DNA alkylation repair protein [Candidatus Paceibacterota bacterium]MDD4875208.1 DNA alkylation repair protein [Candidatus Paceibacterota bacterium]
MSKASKEIIKKLKEQSNPENVAGMARFGINSKNTLGIPVPFLRKTAKEIGKNHDLALELWKSGIHEARLLACFIDEIEKVSKEQMEEWVKDFDSWDVCDQVCMSLFDKTEQPYAKAKQWAKREEEFVRRAGFALMAALASHDKKAENEKFISFFPFIKKYSTDERNFVRKAVNWALRQIGKRNQNLRDEALRLAEEIRKIDSKTAKWVANDALRELKAKKF